MKKDTAALIANTEASFDNIMTGCHLLAVAHRHAQ